MTTLIPEENGMIAVAKRKGAPFVGREPTPQAYFVRGAFL
jgi:hypothetical protein